MPKAPLSDRIYKYFTAALCASALVYIFLILAILFQYGYPSIVVNGLKFFTTTVWNPGALGSNIVTKDGFPVVQGASYGLLVYLEGTLVTSALAILFGVPVSIAIAIFLSQMAPRRFRPPISFLVELLAGIPSVVYGFWGILILGPFLLNSAEPFLRAHLGFIPGFGGYIYSYGLLASGLILALMIVPIVASISRDVMVQAPLELREGAKALGLTDWEVTRKVVLPYAKTGIVGGVILGLGRALGETMAVALVSGGANITIRSVYSPINTLAAFMATSLDGAFVDPTKQNVYALVELAAVLVVLTMLVNILARALVKQGFFKSSEGVVRV
jgi:phosphate transport system permease protein